MTSHVQINPPYDDSAPCPACNVEVRGISALIHNFLVRVRGGAMEPKAMLKLWDLRGEVDALERSGKWYGLALVHPAVNELLECARALHEATEGMTQDGLTIRWPRETIPTVLTLEPRVRSAAIAYGVFSEAHFRDARHSSGQPNILREAQGERGSLDGTTTRYHYTVEVVPFDTTRLGGHDADIVHSPCGTGLKLHAHFMNNLAVDPTFYGKCWCPTCKVNAAWSQFRVLAPLSA